MVCFVRSMERFNTKICKLSFLVLWGREVFVVEFFLLSFMIIVSPCVCVLVYRFVKEEKVERNNRVLLLHTNWTSGLKKKKKSFDPKQNTKFALALLGGFFLSFLFVLPFRLMEVISFSFCFLFGLLASAFFVHITCFILLLVKFICVKNFKFWICFCLLL